MDKELYKIILKHFNIADNKIENLLLSYNKDELYYIFKNYGIYINENVDFYNNFSKTEVALALYTLNIEKNIVKKYIKNLICKLV